MVSKIHAFKKHLVGALKSLELKASRKFAPKKVTKVKLVAIAKNESAYLLEWIFHHLYFGFSEIDIYYNGCTDNTEDLIPLINELPVNLINADNTFESSSQTPQVDIYKACFNKPHIHDCHALMFLDIDEFWIPTNFNDKVVDICNCVGNFDTLSFQWRNKIERNSHFDPAITAKIDVEAAKQIKTLYRSYLRPEYMNPHNVIDAGLNQKYEDGNTLETINEQNSQCKINDVAKNAYILHRKDRSEFEYIAMLLRGRPVNNNAQSDSALPLKGNRQGFKQKYNTTVLSFEGESFQYYRDYMDAKLNDATFSRFIKDAKLHVNARYKLVLKIISEAPPREAALLKRLLTNVTLPDVVQKFRVRSKA